MKEHKTRCTICIMGRVLDQEDGLGVYSTNLLTTMFQMDPSSCYIVLLRSSSHKSTFEKFSNVKTEVLPAPMKTVWDQITVPRAARRFKADIIFNPKFSLPILSRRPAVFVLQGSDWYVNPCNYPWWDNLYIRLMMPVYLRRAAYLLSISQTVRDDLVKFANLNAHKITVSYAAPSPHFRPISDEKALRDFASCYCLPQRFIFAVARAYHTGHARLPQYSGGNIDGLIHGYQRYRAVGGKKPLVIAGKDIENYLKALGFSNGELEGILFTGFIPHQEMVFAYNLADFFVLTTLYESFAFPLVEAMACGCPAIVPSTGACPEVARDAAWLVDPRDTEGIGKAMITLDHSVELRERLRQSGFERVSHFSWEHTAELTLEVFDKIISARGQMINHPQIDCRDLRKVLQHQTLRML